MSSSFLGLRSDAENPPLSPEIKPSEATSSKIVNKRTVLIAAVIILALVILVIVLGALLGAERARQKGKFNIHWRPRKTVSRNHDPTSKPFALNQYRV